MAFKSNATVVSERTCRTSLSSILKTYSPAERDKVKNSVINKVRFELPKTKGVLEAVKAVEETQNYELMTEFVAFLNANNLEDNELLNIINDARTVVNHLSPKFTPLVEALLAVPWLTSSPELIQAFSEFYLDILVAHNRYLSYGVSKLIQLWIPKESEGNVWLNDVPTEEWKTGRRIVHKLLERLLNVIPLAFDAILDAIESQFPYYKKSTHIIVGYMCNLLQLLEYKPIFTECIMQFLMHRLVLLDVNAPRNEIEDLESDTEEDGDEEEVEIKEHMEKDSDKKTMKHPIAKTLDLCMLEIYKFLNTKNFATGTEKVQTNGLKFLKILIKAFDAVILPIHNTHHVQFLLFFYCSLKVSYAEIFLANLWEKMKNPNASAVIRHAAVGYMASFLARSKSIGLNIIKHYLTQLCDWCHQYIKGSDQQYRSNNSLKANLVFYSICQAVFYVIAFRSRDLTKDKKSLLFLQSLQLSALVTCHFNPLRVCLPAVATAFAGVTRAYQLAYCHAILERNARRKLASVYANDTATPEETMDTFFPFDPYSLKLSSKLIKPIYMEYQASEAEECTNNISSECINSNRKRCISENQDDHDIDDFLVPMDKRQKSSAADLRKSLDKDVTLNNGLHC